MYRAAALSQVTYKGQLYALPEFTNQITLIVNNNVAQQAGVAVADIQTTNLVKLRQANKKMLRTDGGRVTRIGVDPKLPEFFPLWVKRYGADLISKDGLKAQLNSKQAVAALTYSRLPDQRSRRLEPVQGVPRHVRLLRANQPDVRATKWAQPHSSPSGTTSSPRARR